MQSLTSIRNTITAVQNHTNDQDLKRLCAVLADLVRHVEELQDKADSTD